MLGTVQYMAPEQLEGGEAAVIAAIIRSEPPPLAELQPLPPALQPLPG